MLDTSVSNFLRQNKQDLARRASEKYFDRHPEYKIWKSGIEHTLEDTAYTLDFLASSIEVKAIDAFTGYIRWLRTVLETRGLDMTMILESLADIGEVLQDFPEASAAAAPYLDAARTGLVRERGVESNLNDNQGAFLQAVLSADRRAAMAVVDHCLRTSEPAPVYADVIAAAMHEVGKLWQANRITVAREHMATATTQYVLAQVYSRQSHSVRNRGRAVVSGIQGEFHQLGAHMAADILEFDGWDVRFLGTNMPHDGIVAAIEEHEATMVGLSATMLTSTPKLVALIDDIKRRSPSTRVLVGGSLVVNKYIDPASMGADGSAASLLEGRELVRGWE